MTDIEYFKNLHQNKNCFIICSGPSLENLDLSPLKRRITFGLNRSFMKYPETTYSCAMDQRLFDLYPSELKQSRYLFTLGDKPFGISLNLLGSKGFSNDLMDGIYSGYTVSYFTLQIAKYMGFKRIFFLGLDLKNNMGKTHFFGHDYRSANHENTEFPKMLDSFEYAVKNNFLENIEVYNCSPISKLECFPYVSFEKALEF